MNRLHVIASMLTRSQVTAVAALLLVVVAVVAPVFGNGYVHDDEEVIVRGNVIHDPGQIWNFFTHHTYYASPEYGVQKFQLDHYRPVPLISFVWDSALSGRAPWAYHLTNLIMHLLCVVLVFRFVRSVAPNLPWSAAFAATACFALSPHPGTAHVWISARYDLFCTFFCLIGVLCWRRSLSTSGIRAVAFHGAGVAAFFTSLLCKEVAFMTLPALLLWPEPQPTKLRLRARRVAGFVTAACVYLFARSVALDGMRTNEGADHVRRALSQLAALEFDGLLGALLPVRLQLRFLNHDYGRLGPTYLTLLALALLASAAIVAALWRSHPAAAWGLFWFACVLAPITMITAVLWPGFGHYLYLPSAGLAVTTASAFGWLLDRPRPGFSKFVWIAVAAYLAVLAVNLRGWVLDHRDKEHLFGGAVLADPSVPHAYGWLGMARLQSGQAQAAVDPLARAYQLAPEEPRYLQHLLHAFVQLGQPSAARAAAQAGIERYQGPESAPFYLYMIEHTHSSDPETACSLVLECLRKAPSEPACARALTDFVTRHPLKARYRAIARRLLANDALVAVREQTAPLLNSLR